MSDMQVPVEELDCGLRVAFLNLPHFRTSSARLTFFSGSLHEGIETAGAAHFLEHVVHQGTAKLPTEQVIREYEEEKGLRCNASTSLTATTYMADGYDLESVGFYVTQMALFPTLSPEALEKERGPIIDEIRGKASNPFYLPNIAHSRALRGHRYARPVTGDISDVIAMTHNNLVDYYNTNYDLRNAILTICSSEPVEKQREYIQTLMETYSSKAAGKTTAVTLEEFNPDGVPASLQQVDLPIDSQTSLGIYYGLPERHTAKERYTQNLLGLILGKLMRRRLRSELAICYAADAQTGTITNLNYGTDQNWSQLCLSTSLNGPDTIQALNAMHDDVLLRELPSNVIERVLFYAQKINDDTLESKPSAVADSINGVFLSGPHEGTIDLEEVKDTMGHITVEDLRHLKRDMLETNSLVYATSPNYEVLERIGNWAISKIAN